MLHRKRRSSRARCHGFPVVAILARARLPHLLATCARATQSLTARPDGTVHFLQLINKYIHYIVTEAMNVNGCIGMFPFSVGWW